MAFDQGQDNVSFGGWEFHPIRARFYKVRVGLYKEKWVCRGFNTLAMAFFSFYNHMQVRKPTRYRRAYICLIYSLLW